MVGRCARAVVFDGAVSTTPRSRQTRNSADTGLSHAPSLAGFACLMPSVAADLPRRGIRARVGRRVSSSAANDRGEAEVRGVERWLLQCRPRGHLAVAAAPVGHTLGAAVDERPGAAADVAARESGSLRLFRGGARLGPSWPFICDASSQADAIVRLGADGLTRRDWMVAEAPASLAAAATRKRSHGAPSRTCNTGRWG